MARISLAVFLSLALPLASAQTFCTQGILPCVQNAVCNNATDQCQCSSGFYGNGRVRCGNVNSCVCTALADPNFSLFDMKTSTPQQVKANLPCSVTATSMAFLGACVLDKILLHPEVRGTGSGANLRVFVNEIEVKMFNPSNLRFSVNASGTNVLTGSAAAVSSAVSADSFQTASITTCPTFQVGYNGTYGGAYINLPQGSQIGAGLCGNCNNQTDENVGATNTTNLAYFLSFIASTADQKGPYASECGSIQALVAAQCNAAELLLVADVCLPYVSPFGTCLIDDAASPGVTNFNTLLTTKFIPCLTSICSTGTVTAQCAALTASQTPTCQLAGNPTNCP